MWGLHVMATAGDGGGHCHLQCVPACIDSLILHEGGFMA